MSSNAFWRIAMRFVLASPRHTGAHLELMSNDDLDHWLEQHGRS
jgi:hypothetical protein